MADILAYRVSKADKQKEMVTTLTDTAPTKRFRYYVLSGASQSLGNYIPFVVLISKIPL